MGTDSPLTESEERIFEAALQVFARVGKAGARMQEIADLAGINKAMLHYYFRTKDRLYEEVFGFVIRKFSSSFGDSVEKAETFEDTLWALIDGYVDFIDQNQDVMKVLVTEMLSGGLVFREQVRDFINSPRSVPPRVFVFRLIEAIQKGEIRAVDPIHTLLTVVSACIFFFLGQPLVRAISPKIAVHPLIPVRNLDSPEEWSRFVQERKKHVYDLVYNGLRTSPATPS